MDAWSRIYNLSDSKYTANVQRFFGICYDYDEKLINTSSVKKCENETNGDQNLHKRKGNNDKKDVQETNPEVTCPDRTPKTEAIRIWPHLTLFQKGIYYLLSFAALFGTVEFVLIFFPFLVWNFDAVIARRASMMWCLCVYSGQAAKDYLRWPRPSSPPVVKLESTNQQEYGMPSTHAMCASAVPFSFAYLLLSRYEVSSVLVIGTVVSLCFLVCLSRLYLGVHSVLDILCGLVASSVLTFIAVPYTKDFDIIQQSHPASPFLMLGFSIALVTVFYPKSTETVTITRGDATQIVAGVFGFLFGSWINYQSGITTDINFTKTGLNFPIFSTVIVAFLRMLTGTIVLVCIELVFKKPLVKLFSNLYKLEKPDRKHPSVEVGYKFILFFTFGFSIMFIVPQLHFLIGLGRADYLNEVQ